MYKAAMPRGGVLAAGRAVRAGRYIAPGLAPGFHLVPLTGVFIQEKWEVAAA